MMIMDGVWDVEWSIETRAGVIDDLETKKLTKRIGASGGALSAGDAAWVNITSFTPP